MEKALFIAGIVLVFWILGKSEASNSRHERNETRTCRHCGMRIPYRAGVCPYCGRDPGMDFRAEGRLFRKDFGVRLMLVLGLIVLICFIAVLVLTNTKV